MVQGTSKKKPDRGGNDLMQVECPISRHRGANMLFFRGSTKNIAAQLVRLVAGRYVLGKINLCACKGTDGQHLSAESGVIP